MTLTPDHHDHVRFFSEYNEQKLFILIIFSISEAEKIDDRFLYLEL